MALGTEDQQEPKTADGYEAGCERGRVVGRGRAAKPAWGRRVLPGPKSVHERSLVQGRDPGTVLIAGVQLENVFGPVSVVDLGCGTWSWVGADHLWGCRPPLVTPGLRSEGQAEPGPWLGTDSGPSF